MLPEVNIIRETGNIGRTAANSEGVAAMVLGGVAVAPTGIVTGIALGDIVILTSLKSAERIGLDEDYDIAKKVLVHYHISEFFRMNPSGELHLMIVPQNTLLEDMVNKNNPYLKKVLRQGEGKIRKAAVVSNFEFGNEPASPHATDSSLLGHTLNAIVVAQELADDEYSEKRPLNNVLIEGLAFDPSITTNQNLRNPALPPNRDVSIVVGQDSRLDYDNPDWGHTKFTACVGALLGLSTNKEAHECFAQPIESNDLVSATDGSFLVARFSNGQKSSDYVQADLDFSHNRGYIFPRIFPGYPGIYFNQSHVAAPETDDYNASELRDVINKAVRITRNVLIPYINSTEFSVDGTGRIVKYQRAALEAEIRTAIELDMRNNISSLESVIVDPPADGDNVPYPAFLSDRQLRVFIAIIPKGKAEKITGFVGYTTGV